MPLGTWLRGTTSTDLATLDRWLDRSFSVTSVSELLDWYLVAMKMTS